MRTNVWLPALCLTALTILACEETEPFFPGGGGGGFRVAWPSAAATVDDSETFAIAIFPPTLGDTGQITFRASIDNGPDIGGLRNGRDSLVAFEVTGLTNGSHTITVRASSGQVATRVFNVSLVPRPTITSVVPDTAVLTANQPITITGTSFIGDVQRMRVLLNGVRLPISGVPTTTQVVAIVQQSSFGPVRSGLLAVEADRRISRELRPFRVIGATSPPAGQAQILLADPSMAPRNAPVVIYGQAFGAGDIPSFGPSASSPILLLGSETFPQPIGLVQFGLTIVPGLAPRQDSFLTINTDAGTSTAFPFFIE